MSKARYFILSLLATFALEPIVLEPAWAMEDDPNLNGQSYPIIPCSAVGVNVTDLDIKVGQLFKQEKGQEDTEADTENQHCIIHNFRNSPYNHLMDVHNQDSLLRHYKIILLGLRRIDINIDDINEGLILAEYVEKLRDLEEADLHHICDITERIYNGATYEDLDCEPTQWYELAEKLKGIPRQKREMLPQWTSYFPSTCNISPTELMEQLLKEKWRAAFNREEDRVRIKALLEKECARHDQGHEQLKALERAMRWKGFEGF